MSDFQGGNGGTEPPIDLDALRKRFQGYKGKLKLPGPAIVLVIIGVAWLLTGIYTVGPDEQAVIRRFGKFMEPTQGPGLHLRIPWPVDRVDKVAVTKIYSTEVGFRTVQAGPPARYSDVPNESLMLTGDENIVAADFIVQYMIADPVKYLFKIKNAETTLKEAAESAMREVVGNRKIDDVLTERKAEIQADVFTLMQASLDGWETGLRLQAVKLQDVTPPGPVDAAFKDVASAREDKDRIVKQADGYRNDLLPKASGEAAKMLNEAQAYAQAKLKRAEGESERFRELYKEYALARDITRKRLYIEAMEDVMASAEKIILDGPAGKNLLPYLPVRRGKVSEQEGAMNKKAIVLILLAAIGFGIFVSATFTVDQTESVIVLQFGNPKRTLTEPGIHFKIPVMQQIVKLDNRILDYDAAPTDIVTKDKKTIVVDNFAKWRITDPLLFYQSVGTYAKANARLDEIVYSELRVDVGSANLSEIVSGKRAELMDKVTERSDKAARNYGFEVIAVRIKRADLPEANERAVYNRMVAERQRDAKRYRSEGEEESAKITSTADKEKAIILADAYKKAQEIMGVGDADALRVYAKAYNLDPSFYEFTRTLEAYRAALRNETTLVLSPDSDFLRFLKTSR